MEVLRLPRCSIKNPSNTICHLNHKLSFSRTSPVSLFYALLNERSRSINHPSGNLASLLMHIGTHSNYLPLTIYQENPGINIITYYDPSVFTI